MNFYRLHINKNKHYLLISYITFITIKIKNTNNKHAQKTTKVDKHYYLKTPQHTGNLLNTPHSSMFYKVLPHSKNIKNEALFDYFL